MKFRVLMVISVITALFGFAVYSFADEDYSERYAIGLYKLGLFQGTGIDDAGNPIFDLDKTANRQEALVMLVRLLGKEEEALQQINSHPFTDVASWANAYVGYAYQNGLAKGISPTKFGGNNIVNSQQYITFLLRALKYDDTKGDFSYANVHKFSDSIGLTNYEYSIGESSFVRRDMVSLSAAALLQTMNGIKSNLVDYLYDQKVISGAQYNEGIDYLFPPVEEEETAYQLFNDANRHLQNAGSYAANQNLKIQIKYGDNVLETKTNSTVKEITSGNKPGFEVHQLSELEGVKTEVHAYYTDGYYYVNNSGTKIKNLRKLNAARKDIISDIKFSEREVKTQQIEEKNGFTYLYFTLKPNGVKQLLAQNQTLNSLMSAGSTVTIVDAFCDAVMNPNGYLDHIEMSFTANLNVNGVTYELVYKLVSDTTQIGDVEINYPSELNSYVEII